jgi:hypothetical protein
MAQLDLRVGPLHPHVADTARRDDLFQFIDAWTNNFAYVGRRAAGTTAGDFLLVPPGWSGEPLEDATVIHVPTTIATVVGRWACSGENDLPAPGWSALGRPARIRCRTGEPAPRDAGPGRSP